MVKQYLSLAAIALASFSSSVYAKGVAEVIGCVGETKICTNLDEQRNYAEFIARVNIKEALQNTYSAPIHIVIQSDALDTVMHFQFTAFRDEALTLNYEKGVEIGGEVKNSVKQLVSSEVATRNLAKLVMKDSNYALDFDKFCDNGSGIERTPHSMVTLCKSALFDSGFYTEYQILKEHHQIVNTTFSAKMSASFSILFAGEAGSEASYDGSVKKTIEFGRQIEFGRPFLFRTTDGYEFVLVPKKDGTAHCSRFLVPLGNEIKVDKDGLVDQEQFKKDLESHVYSFNQDSLRFLKMQQHANGGRLEMLDLLIQKLEECPTCTVTIEDVVEMQSD
ncbi:hypothetical protein [Pseudoalteromonas sp. MTN2-4]|uniref:hypothetical protein n=1 Tax=Pseudoalteromonas sp. MTN2-4 TaxID=3056555 RepID=UPI0036F25B9C